MNNPNGNFFLIGLMGAGKTTVGRMLARRTNKDFYDSDHAIEQRTGVPIRTIFDIEGEQRFRERESAVIAHLVTQSNIVLATGGGVILSEDNRRLLRKHGTVIYLRAQVNDLLKRTQNDRYRPLLQATDPRNKLAELFDIRDPLYRQTAHLIIDSSQQNINTLVNRLIAELKALAGSGL